MNENEILNRFYELNKLDKSFKYKERIKGTKFNKYFIPSWMSGKGDIWIRNNAIKSFLESIGLNSQLYYDIMELKIKCIEDRPKCKCPGCNNPAKFYNLTRGYSVTCSKSCSSRKNDLDPVKNETLRNTFCISRRGLSNSKSHREKCSKKLKGRFISAETRDKISKTMLERYEDPNEIIKRIHTDKPSRTRKGWIKITKSESSIYYGSSWEKFLIELCESSNEVKLVHKCKVIPYVFNDESKRYLPDLLVELNNGSFILFEVKPSYELNLPKVQAKAKYAIEWCKIMNYEYRFFTEKDIKTAKTGDYKFIR